MTSVLTIMEAQEKTKVLSCYMRKQDTSSVICGNKQMNRTPKQHVEISDKQKFLNLYIMFAIK